MKIKPRVLAIGLSILVACSLSSALPTPKPVAGLKAKVPSHLVYDAPIGKIGLATGMSQGERTAMLNFYLGTGRQSGGAFLAAFTVMGADDGTGFTEVTGGGYARINITDNSTNFPAVAAASPSVLKLATSESFPAATSDWMSGAPVVGYGFYSASTSGTFLGSMYALSTPIIVTADTTGLFTAPAAHGFSANDAIRFVISSGATIAAGVNTTATWYVIASGLTTTAFKVSSTQGGSAVTITAAAIAGFMRAFKSFVGAVLSGTTLTIPANNLQIQLTGF